MVAEELVVSVRDKGRVTEAIQLARASWATYAPSLDSLRSELRRAHVVPPPDVPGDVITMNSRFEVRDVRSGEAGCYALVYPDDGAPEHGSVSVLSPAGMAFFGARVGEVVRWGDADGPRTVKVERLLYQPEAAGNYDL